MARKAFVCVACFALAGATAALGQGVITTIKTPPMQASEVITLPLAIHPAAPAPPWAGWAGARMKAHIMDAGELDVDAIVPTAGGTVTGPPYIEPFGPRSMNAQSVPIFFTAWHPLAQQSGIPVQPSVNLPVFNMTLHAKNSDPSGNSDVDMTLMFWNIWHIRDGLPGSTLVHLDPSAYILVPSSIQDLEQLHRPDSLYQFPTNPVQPGEPGAKWLHIEQPVTFHLPGGPGSQFYATFLNTATIGIEHVPEPMSAVMLVGGAFCAVMSRRARSRRRSDG